MLGSVDIVTFVATTDYDKARAFYRRNVGSEICEKRWLCHGAGSERHHAADLEAAPIHPAQFTVLGWQVKDIEQIAADLQARGVHFERFGFFEQDALGIWTAPTGDKVAWFKDPDGNILSVSQQV